MQAPCFCQGLAQTLPSPRAAGDTVPPPPSLTDPLAPSQGTEHFLPCFGTLWVHTLSCLFTCDSEGRATSVCVLKSQPRARVELVAYVMKASSQRASLDCTVTVTSFESQVGLDPTVEGAAYRASSALMVPLPLGLYCRALPVFGVTVLLGQIPRRLCGALGAAIGWVGGELTSPEALWEQGHWSVPSAVLSFALLFGGPGVSRCIKCCLCYFVRNDFSVNQVLKKSQ